MSVTLALTIYDVHIILKQGLPFFYNISSNIGCVCFLQLKYKEDYNKNVKGQWCETPYFDVAIARMAMDNLSSVRVKYYKRGAGFRYGIILLSSCS